MAANGFTIRCNSQHGSFVISDMNSESTVNDLKLRICMKEGLLLGKIKILCGYPPRALAEGVDDLKLMDVGIHSGETIYIEKISDSESGGSLVLGPSGDTGVTRERSDTRDKSSVAFNVGSSDFPRPPGIMMRHVVPSNNSCLFTSVFYVMFNGNLDAEKSNELRNLIANIVSGNPEKYNTAFLGMTNEDYCAWIKDTNHWGGAIELAILSEYFEVEIAAVDTVHLKMHRFGENCNYSNRIFLIYDGIHYDPLMMELENGTMQTIFRIEDDAPIEMAMEVAREAHSSKQFTDMANFTLRCMKCDEKLRGDKEARQHALDTGHVDFGEITQ